MHAQLDQTHKMPQPNRRQRRRVWLGLVALLLSQLLLPAAARAQPPATANRLTITGEGGGLRLHWQAGAQSAGLAAGPAVDLPLEMYNGYLLPMQTLQVELTPGSGDLFAASVNPTYTSSPFQGELQRADALTPPALPEEGMEPPQPLAITPTLPSAPLFVMRQGSERNRTFATLAFSSIYQDPATGEIRQVESLDAAIPGISLAQATADQDITADQDVIADPANAALFAPVADLASAPPPTNFLLNRAGVAKLFVSQPGLQQISLPALAAVGVNTGTQAKLRAYYQGREVPLHISGDQVRFYAPTAGDPLNNESVYWIYAAGPDGPDGLRMATRSATTRGAPERANGYEPGRFTQPVFYDSAMPGSDGDGWFHADLSTSPSVADPIQPSGLVTPTFSHRLPLIGDNSLPTRLTVYATAYNSSGGQIAHQLAMGAGGDYTYSDPTNAWIINFAGAKVINWVNQVDTAREFTLDKAADTWWIALRKGSVPLGIKLNYIDYLLPVQLNFGGKGAIFQGVDGNWTYRLRDTVAGRALYDITDPTQPQLLTGLADSGRDARFQDGPSARRYLVSGDGVVFTPRAEAHTPVNFTNQTGAQALYIAPAIFHADLQPLIALRQSQGYSVRITNVQQVYDAWSFGMVAPTAIRSFLRYAVGNWRPAPIAVTLVGDATWDPRDYQKLSNPNHIPAYMLEVDPWLGHTACETCYAQLNGDHPLDESAFIPDIWLGRFPVADAAELRVVVNKIVGYESATDSNALWRRNSVQLVDDYVLPNGNNDSAGDFIRSVTETIELTDQIIITRTQSGAIAGFVNTIRHHYSAFGPNDDLSTLTPAQQDTVRAIMPYATNDYRLVNPRTLNLLNGGVGLVTFTGHSNHWKWGSVGPTNQGTFLGLWDILRLNNRDQLFIALSMTCYTSQFHIPAPYHFTLDEHLLLHSGGGAVAVWGSSGNSLVPCHDRLKKGFNIALWNAPAQRAKIGALTQAGYRNVLGSTLSCVDVSRTFLLLGDPLTTARVQPLDGLYLPNLHKAARVTP